MDWSGTSGSDPSIPYKGTPWNLHLPEPCVESHLYRYMEYQASLQDNNLTDTGIPSAGPGGNPFYNIPLLAREEARPRTPESPPPPNTNLIYSPDL
eukprot:530309-Pelagomonas_calceolata.AAC.1